MSFYLLECFYVGILRACEATQDPAMHGGMAWDTCYGLVFKVFAELIDLFCMFGRGRGLGLGLGSSCGPGKKLLIRWTRRGFF